MAVRLRCTAATDGTRKQLGCMPRGTWNALLFIPFGHQSIDRMHRLGMTARHVPGSELVRPQSLTTLQTRISDVLTEN